jgi:hypothetical protein
MIKKLILSCFFITITTVDLSAGQEIIEVFPSTPYDRYTIYGMLVLFWAGIIGLIVIIRMKLKEIERTQDMGIDKEEKGTPFLD